MQERFHHLTMRLATDEQTPINSDCLHSLYMKGAFKLNYERVIAPLGADVEKDESLGHLWSDALPINGQFTFEVGCEVPYYLPNVEGKAEYILLVNTHHYIVCNRMVKAFWTGDKSDTSHALDYLFFHRLALPQLLKNEEFMQIHPVPAKTFISRQFVCEAQTAEEAIEDNFRVWQHEILTDISQILAAMRIILTGEVHPFLPLSQVFTPMFWVAILGQDGQAGCEQFIDNAWFSAHRALHNINGDDVKELQKLLSGEKIINPSQVALSLAYTFTSYGYLDSAIVQACIACETSLTRKLHDHLRNRGLSKTHLEKHFDTVTFSQLLNLHLPCIIDLTSLPDYTKLLGDVNWARKRRNEIVHQGQSLEKLEKTRIQEVLQSFSMLLQSI